MSKAKEEETSYSRKHILQNLPDDLSVFRYVEARAQEMVAMTNAAQTVRGNNQPLQKLPRHMRRRAASHYAKRLPRTMHSWAKKEQEKAGLPKKNKRPSRRHRRRPRNLLEEYSRRKRNHVWLETHIWHAKRFHMAKLWGYNIPFHPNDKGARAAYRASAKYCLLQDYSYYCCVELSGCEQAIVDHLSHLCSSETGLTFGARLYRNGSREGELIVYHYDHYPHGVMGPVKFMWRCVTSEQMQSSDIPPRQLWIWVHPAMYREFMHALRITICSEIESTNMKSDQTMLDCSTSALKHSMSKNYLTSLHESTENLLQNNKTKSGNISESASKDLSNDNMVISETFTGSGITVTSLKDSICRFHLTGPLSNEVLLETLKISQIDKNNHGKCTLSDDTNVQNVGGENCSWWETFYENRSHTESWHLQNEMWEGVRSLESPGELPAHCIIGLTVRDPRVLLPRKKSMVQYENKVERAPAVMQITDAVSSSPLWERSVREAVKTNKKPDCIINDFRSKFLVPGMELPQTDEESRIPVILVNNPGSRDTESKVPRKVNPIRTGYNSGWDVIIPAGWSLPFLISMVFRGARIAGLQEVNTLAVESGDFIYPNNFPDSYQGAVSETTNFVQHKEKFERIPPAKRPSYQALGVSSPFSHPWAELLSKWRMHVAMNNKSNVDIKDFFVLRKRSDLKNIQSALWPGRDHATKTPREEPPLKKSRKCENDQSSVWGLSESLREMCLVPAHVSLIRRGHADQYSMICLPTSDDLVNFNKDRTYCGPLEPKHDSLKEEKAKNTKQMEEEGEFKKKVLSTAREIIGYVTAGNFSFGKGHSTGYGFIAYNALEALRSTNPNGLQQCVVLTRTTTSLQYRFAYLIIAV